MYAVTRDSDTQFSLLSTTATATNVDSEFQYGTGQVGDPITVTGTGTPVNDFYDYAGTTSITGGGTGYIVYNAVDHDYYMLTNTAPASAGTLGALDSSADNSNALPCFMNGTLVRTPAGEVRVEELKAGDLLATHDGRAVPVRWIGRRAVSSIFGCESSAPIRIKAGAFAENVPCRDLLVSPDHAIFVDGVLIHAGALINGISIIRESKPPSIFIYYHVETDDHSLILAENTVAETFVDNVDRMGFDNWLEHEALYPDGKSGTRRHQGCSSDEGPRLG
jgi:hypothetical protein